MPPDGARQKSREMIAAAVGEPLEHGQALGHDPVAGPPVQVRDEAHAAGIVLVRWVVKAGGTRGATDGLGHRHPSGLGSTAP